MARHIRFILPLATALLLGVTPATASTALVDQTGAPYAIEARHATPVVLTFVAAHCKDTCPLINAQFATVQQQISRTHLPLTLVTVTLDPEHDTARDMQKLATTFHANPQTWHLLAGNAIAVHRIMQRFGAYASRGGDGYADVHTTFVYLLNQHGHLVKTILASTQLPQDLFAEVLRDWGKLSA